MDARIGSIRLVWLSLALAASALLTGCGSAPKSMSEAPAVRSAPKSHPALPAAGSGRGGYYLDDGPADRIPDGLMDVPDAVPKIEPYARGPNRPYEVFGQTYVPITDNRPYKARGYGSWYGKKFHGKPTSSGERYDMFKMTAAHPTLPIPCYARVTNLGNGRQVIVRVNDRGPFRSGRIIDLSYTAALKLGYLGKGSGQLEVEHLLPAEIERLAQARRTGTNSTTVAAKPDSTELALTDGRDNIGQEGRYGDFLDKFLAESSSEGKTVLVAGERGYYLQLGVYRQAGNAHSMQAKFMTGWRKDIARFEVVNSGEFFKLLAGPFSTREKALDAARRFQASEGVNPLIVQR